MTNDQQAYDRAMAHNAMLREALWKYANCGPFDFQPSDAEEILNATEADVEAWEKKLRQEVMLAVHPLQPEYEKLQQQLATVTVERDALREFVGLIAIHKNDAYCSRDLSGLGFDAFYLLERLRQSPPSK